jgi:phosphoribosylformylglycinamidine (FGAM) synthase-like amidotransferase family enzyme
MCLFIAFSPKKINLSVSKESDLVLTQGGFSYGKIIEENRLALEPN